VLDEDDGVWLVVPRWGVEQRLRSDPKMRRSFEVPAALILENLGLIDRSMRIEVFSEIPRAMGLGGSAAVAVAIIRALDRHFALGLADAEVNSLAFQSEQVASALPPASTTPSPPTAGRCSTAPATRPSSSPSSCPSRSRSSSA
jgi:hydroxymethylglutaryl-CoA reductase